MGQNKLFRFEAIKTFINVLEYPPNMPGKWAIHFGNQQPITLELACGKGEYALGLGKLFPERNFIGVDIKGNRIWVGAKHAQEHHLKNVAFLRTQIDQIENYFAPGEVDQIWITFPDPQLRFSKAKKRLTHPVFLRRYAKILSPGGSIHLKTDSPALYQFTKAVIEVFGLEIITDNDNVYKDGTPEPTLAIKTHYESLDIAGANTIHYLNFRIKDVLPIEKDAVLKELIREYEFPEPNIEASE